ncbi:MAG: NifB/NifX family molybdenum-iron cluster-binding protein [Bacteroidales bacterium]|nr:NifB/NifX family molybdenum-iron cluster-binding protein [Bacteroidales bacterium]
MKIAFTTKGTEWDSMMDPRFGRAEYLLIYDEDEDKFTHYDNRAIANEAHGAGPQTAQKLFELAPNVLITGNGPGGNAATVLEKAGMKIFIGAGEMTVQKAYEAYKNKTLNEF